MKSKKFSAHRMVILLVLCIIVTGCPCGTTFTIVPIREGEFREEHALPLDKLKIEEFIEFIADGGVHRDNGFQASVEHEAFRRFLLNSMRVFLFVIIPLLIIAGIVEGVFISFLGN